MGKSSSIQIITMALSISGPKSLSYVHSDLRWLIRDHLLSFLDEFPTFSVSAADFVTDTGATVRLLNLRGHLPLRCRLPPPHLTIWLHHHYPLHRPIVSVDGSGGSPAIIQNHPFVDSSSGAVVSPYLEAWEYPRSNLVDLARNLSKALSLCPLYPLEASRSTDISPVDMKEASRREARDRLSARVHHELVCFEKNLSEEIEQLLKIQMELRKRRESIDGEIDKLEKQRKSLEMAVSGLKISNEIFANWIEENLTKNSFTTDDQKIVEAFGVDDEELNSFVEYWAADMAIDDVVEHLEDAMEAGVVEFGVYLKQVRALSREQFYCRAYQQLAVLDKN